ncbi:MAG: peptidoglycan-binding protein [Burkholderiales bacterium]|nr:peptidoglycan-binding protein [Burkholderiales bacterium]
MSMFDVIAQVAGKAATLVSEELRAIGKLVEGVVGGEQKPSHGAAGGGIAGGIGGAAKRAAEAAMAHAGGAGGGKGAGAGAPAGMIALGSSGPAVAFLQHVLNAKGASPKLKEDGVFGPRTDAAVKNFQRSKGLAADGIVGPKTWKALNGDGSVRALLHKGAAGKIASVAQAGKAQAAEGDAKGVVATFNFPLAQIPTPDWTGGARFFGAPRDGGRLHAGCDLLAPVGTTIFAIGDGVLVRGPYPFTGPWMGLNDTDAVEIRHGPILVRYGEIARGSYTGGQNVHGGQPIARVGQPGRHAMLHFEVYSNGSSAASLSGSNRYRRRNDVTDPAPLLAVWRRHLPTSH